MAKAFAILNFGSFSGDICFSAGYSHEELLAALKRKRKTALAFSCAHHKDLFHPQCALETSVDDDGVITYYYFIFIEAEFDFSDHDMVMLAHEVLHVCQFRLPKMLDRDREYECEAYTHTHIMNQCLKELRKNGK